MQGSARSKKQEAPASKQFTPYKELDTNATLKSMMPPQLKQSRSPAKIRINASIRNQPYRMSGSDQNKDDESEKASKMSNSVDPTQMNDMERLEPYLKP